MNPQQDPLANLHDIVLPNAIGWWPLAPGWWALLALCILIIIAASRRWLRHYYATSYRRQAQRSLDNWLAEQPNESTTDAQSWAFFNHWCKRTLLYQTHRAELSSLTGKQWQAYLQQQAHPLPQTVIQQLGDQLYCPEPAKQAESISNAELHQIGLRWLRKQPALTPKQGLV